MAEVERPEVKEKKQGGSWIPALIGFGTGAIVGAVTALMYAPQSGKETREKIRDRMTDYSEKAGAIIGKSKEALDETKDRMSDAYEDAVERTSSAIQHAKDKLGKKDTEEE